MILIVQDFYILNIDSEVLIQHLCSLGYDLIAKSFCN